jgi:NADH-quinone oxidoreductase subunit J
MTQFLFYFLSFVAVSAGLMVITAKNPVHSVLYLIIAFFAIAGHYILLNAQFLAIVHIIVYAGAIMVLFLSVIMLLNLNKDNEPAKSNVLKLAAAVAAGLLLVTFTGTLKGTESIIAAQPYDDQIGYVKALGKVLFNDFLLPFEVSALLLLSAIIGAVVLVKHDLK